MTTSTEIPDAAHKRLRPYLEAYVRRLSNRERDAIDEGDISTKILTDGTVHALVVTLVHPWGTWELMRLDPIRVGLHVFDGGLVVYVPSDEG